MVSTSLRDSIVVCVMIGSLCRLPLLSVAAFCYPNELLYLAVAAAVAPLTLANELVAAWASSGLFVLL
jgi:hypothetical protein